MIRGRIKSLFRQNDSEGRPTPDDGQWENVVEISHNVRMKVLHGEKRVSINLKGIIRVVVTEVYVDNIVSQISAGDAVTWIKAKDGEVFFAELSMEERVLYIEQG